MRKAAILLIALLVFPSLESMIASSPHPGASAAIHQHEHSRVPVATNVSYNTNTGKYHVSGCRYWGCKNCVTITKDEAIRRGGVACKVCG
jgi:PHP family Zn ribbon phosphoesterase